MSGYPHVDTSVFTQLGEALGGTLVDYHPRGPGTARTRRESSPVVAHLDPIRRAPCPTDPNDQSHPPRPHLPLNALLSASPSLVRLEMRALPAATDETCAILAMRCRALAWLYLGCCSNLGPRALPSICGTNTDGGLKRLRVLHMSSYPHVDTSVFTLLGGTLETLDLGGVWDVTDACLAAFVDMEPSAAQAEIARLAEVERWARARAADGRPDIVPHTPFVSLTAREAVLNPTLPGPFFRRRTALCHLNLSGCRCVSDTGIGALAHAVPDLEIPQLAGIGSIMSSPGLVRLFRTTGKIRRVDLEDANISHTVLEPLTPPLADDGKDETSSIACDESVQIAMRADPVHPGHTPSHLVLSHCTQVTSGALTQVVRACPRLTVLALNGTPVDDRVARFFVCAARARGLVGAKIGAADIRFFARAGLPTSSIHPRRGMHEWATCGLGYVDAWDDADDECDERNVVVKTYWSWQAVDSLLERRRASLATARRNTYVGSSGLRAGPRWGRHKHDEQGGCAVM
ncbi:hypothetical protein FRC06_001232 [Ceratobasidium sp. 370]|nr:hypothetical protein FRC06_001232 [Ceratobasidium sp. 370]